MRVLTSDLDLETDDESKLLMRPADALLDKIVSLETLETHASVA